MKASLSRLQNADCGWRSPPWRLSVSSSSGRAARNPFSSHPRVSHSILLIFFGPNAGNEKITNIAGIAMKTDDDIRPLTASAVRITDNAYVIVLAADALQSNMAILQHLPSFEIQLLLSNGRRATLSLEKGLSGDSAFAAAFAAWERQGR